MRISDWSSDVCSSDLAPADAQALVFGYGIGLDLTRRDLQAAAKARGLPWDTGKAFDHSAPVSELVPAADVGGLAAHTVSLSVDGKRRQHGALADLIWTVPDILHELRSEEHTSELQSLMRISYAVFCLNKKKKIIQKIKEHRDASNTISSV